MASAARKRPQYLNGRTAKYQTAGSAAYDVGYAGGAARPLPREGGRATQPRVLPRERVTVRPRAVVREKGEASLFSIVGCVAIAVVAVMLLMSYANLLSASDQVVSLRSELSTLQTEQARLLAEYEVSIDLKSIEEAVTANGHMVKPQSEQIVYYDSYESDSVVFYADESPTKGAEGALESLGGIWNNIVSYFK